MAISHTEKNAMPTPQAMAILAADSDVSRVASYVTPAAIVPMIGPNIAQNDAAHGNGGGLGLRSANSAITGGAS